MSLAVETNIMITFYKKAVNSKILFIIAFFGILIFSNSAKADEISIDGNVASSLSTSNNLDYCVCEKFKAVDNNISAFSIYPYSVNSATTLLKLFDFSSFVSCGNLNQIASTSLGAMNDSSLNEYKGSYDNPVSTVIGNDYVACYQWNNAGNDVVWGGNYSDDYADGYCINDNGGYYCNSTSDIKFLVYTDPTYTGLPSPTNENPLNFALSYSAPINYSYSVPFTYWPSVFTSPTDWVAVWQCAGENYQTPDCNSLTFIGSSTVWSPFDKLMEEPSGIGRFILSATSSVYRTYKAVSRSSLFSGSFDPDYFSITWGEPDLSDFFSDGEFNRDQYCSEANVCYGMATSTLGGIVGCGMQRSICWAFTVSTSSKGYFTNSFNGLKSAFPFNTFFDITESFKGFATSTSANKSFKLPVPAIDQDGHATTTMQALISSSTTKRVIGTNNYNNIRQGIVWFAWIMAGGYVILRLNHKHI